MLGGGGATRFAAAALRLLVAQSAPAPGTRRRSSPRLPVAAAGLLQKSVVVAAPAFRVLYDAGLMGKKSAQKCACLFTRERVRRHAAMKRTGGVKAANAACRGAFCQSL